jgi:signal transduction histidine kinase
MNKTFKPKYKQIPILFLITFIALSSIIWVQDYSKSSKSLEYQTELIVKTLSDEIEDEITRRIDLIEILGQEWLNTENSSLIFQKSRFENKVARYFEHYTGYLAINWINSSGIIKWVYPFENNTLALNRSIVYLLSGNLNYAFYLAQHHSVIGLTNVTELFQGGFGIVTYQPLIYFNKTTQKNETVGYLNGVIKIDTFIDEITASDPYLTDYSFKLEEYSKSFYKYQENVDASEKFTKKQSISFYNRTWNLYLRPNQAIIDEISPQGTWPIYILALLGSVFCSLLISGIIGFIKKLEDSYEERDEIKSQLFKSQKLESLGTLAGGMAHDYNNILMGVLGNIEIMKLILNENQESGPLYNPNIKSQFEDKFSSIFELIKRAKEISQDILQFSRSSPLSLEPIEIVQIIKSTIRLFSKGIDKKIQISYDINYEMVYIFGNQTRFQQILMNLLFNSKDALPNGGKISIKVKIEVGISHKPSQVLISMEDTGFGIPEGEINKIFDPFYTTKDIGKGTGLGLSIVHNAVTLMRGTIRVESKVNKGTNFILRFPQYFPKPNEILGKLSSIEPISEEILKNLLNGQTVLIVEDEKHISQFIYNILSKYTSEILIAPNGEKGLETFNKSADLISLAILDINLPEMNGVELYKEIITIKPKQQILFITGYSIEKIPDLDKNEVMLLQKPFESESLKQMIFQILNAK